VNVLLDSHVLLWATYEPRLVPPAIRADLEDPRNAVLFSAASIWEIGIKASIGRDDFTVDARILRRGLVENGYVELPISSAHAVEAAALPPIHRDPFDRMLVAQARAEGFALLTSDARVAEYGPPARLVDRVRR
jgi:PIN domain nuclease of toxin-antitoxin system